MGYNIQKKCVQVMGNLCSFCGKFFPDKNLAAGCFNQIRDKSPAKWGVQIAGMIFVAHSKQGKGEAME